MNEAAARSLTRSELAERYRYHDDPGVARLSQMIRSETEEERVREALETRIGELESERDDYEVSVSDLRELLDECREKLEELEELGGNEDLINRICAA